MCSRGRFGNFVRDFRENELYTSILVNMAWLGHLIILAFVDFDVVSAKYTYKEKTNDGVQVRVTAGVMLESRFNNTCFSSTGPTPTTLRAINVV